MRFKAEISQVLRLYEQRAEGTINDAELLASVNGLLETIFLEGQVSQLRRLVDEGRRENEEGSHE